MRLLLTSIDQQSFRKLQSLILIVFRRLEIIEIFRASHLEMGQRLQLSILDINKVNLFYSCATKQNEKRERAKKCPKSEEKSKPKSEIGDIDNKMMLDALKIGRNIRERNIFLGDNYGNSVNSPHLPSAQNLSQVQLPQYFFGTMISPSSSGAVKNTEVNNPSEPNSIPFKDQQEFFIRTGWIEQKDFSIFHVACTCIV